jgi:hypothetical protein
LPKSTSRIEPAPGAAPVVDRKQPSQASGSGSGSRSQVPQQGIPLGVLVAAVAAVVIIIGAAVAWKQLSKPESVPTPMLETPTVATKAPVIETPDAPAKVEPVAIVKVTINTTPVGAEVSEEGVTIGNAPLIIDWPRGATRTLTFKLAGYKELSKTVRSEAAQSFDFPLEPARSKPVDGSKKPPTKNTPEMGAFD